MGSNSKKEATDRQKQKDAAVVKADNHQQKKKDEKQQLQQQQQHQEETTMAGKLYGMISRSIQFLIAVILIGFLTNLLFLRVQKQNVQFDTKNRSLISLDSNNSTVFSTYCVTNNTSTAPRMTILIEGSIGSFHQSMEKLSVLLTSSPLVTKLPIQVCSYDRLGVGLFSSPLTNESSYLQDTLHFYEKFALEKAKQQPIVVVAHGYGANLFSNVFFSSSQSSSSSSDQNWRQQIKNVILVDPILTDAQWDELSLQNTVQQFLALSGMRRLAGRVMFDSISGVQYLRRGLFNVHSLFPGAYDLSNKSQKLKLERTVILNDQTIYEQANNNLKRLKESAPPFLKPFAEDNIKKSTSTEHVDVQVLVTTPTITLPEEQMWWKSLVHSHQVSSLDKYEESELFDRLASLVFGIHANFSN